MRALVKSINYVENPKKQEKVLRYSVNTQHFNSEGSLPPMMGSAGSTGFPDAISEDEEELAESVSQFFVQHLPDEHEPLKSAQSAVPLWGRPRLDGNWGKYFTADKRHPIATFYDPLHPDHMDSTGFASMQGGHTPSLFLQELAHLTSLLFADVVEHLSDYNHSAVVVDNNGSNRKKKSAAAAASATATTPMDFCLHQFIRDGP